MKQGWQSSACPLCGRPAEALDLPNLARLRVNCEECTTFEISDGLQKLLSADNPALKDRVPYLSSAARRATHGIDQRAILDFCLKLTEKNYIAKIADEEAFQHSIQPVVDYLIGAGIPVKSATVRGSFTHLDVLTPNGKQALLKVKSALFYDHSAKEIEDYCRYADIAKQLAKSALGGSVEINESVLKGRPKKD